MADPIAPASSTTEAVQKDPDFSRLRHGLRRFAFPVTVAFLAWYFLYVVVSAFSLRQEEVGGQMVNVKTALGRFMDTPLIGDHINVALIFGLLQFVSTFVIAYLYARYARTRLDPRAERLRHAHEAAHDPAAEGRSA